MCDIYIYFNPRIQIDVYEYMFRVFWIRKTTDKS